MRADQMRQVPCPNCQTPLTVPPGSEGKSARCGKCQHRFQIPPEVEDVALSEDEVLSVLGTQEDEVDLAAESQLPETTDAGMSTFAGAPGMPVETINIRKVRANGALVDFPADFLLDKHFRCAMPRTCMCCGTRANLTAHLLRFVPHDKEAGGTARQTPVSLPIKDPTLQRLTDMELGWVPGQARVPTGLNAEGCCIVGSKL